MKLTDEEIMRMSGPFWFDGQTFSVLGFARALLAAHPDHSGDGGETASAAVFPMAQPGHCINCGLSDSPSCACVRGRELAQQATPVPQDGDERINTKALREHASKGWGDNCLLPKGSVKRIADELDALRAALASNKAAAVAVGEPNDDLLSLLREMVDLHGRNHCVLKVHMERLSELLPKEMQA